MYAYQVITLSAIGEAETPAGGSVCIRCERSCINASSERETVVEHCIGGKGMEKDLKRTLKSRIRRLRAGVDIFPQATDGEALEPLFRSSRVQKRCPDAVLQVVKLAERWSKVSQAVLTYFKVTMQSLP